MINTAAKYFDIKGAAEYLSCTVSDISYYLREAKIHFAIPLRHFEDESNRERWLQGFIFTLDKIFDDEWDYEQLLSNKPTPDQLSKFCKGFEELNTADAIDQPDFLYVSFDDIQRFSDLDYGSGLEAHYLRLLSGEPVSIWDLADNENDEPIWYLTTLNLGEISTEQLEKAKISKEEIDLIFSVINEPTELPFKPLKRMDDFAHVLLEFGNAYFHEFAKRPTPSALLNYMLKHPNGGDSIGIEPYSGKGCFKYNDTVMDAENLKDRIKNMTKGFNW